MIQSKLKPMFVSLGTLVETVSFCSTNCPKKLPKASFDVEKVTGRKKIFVEFDPKQSKNDRRPGPR